MPDHSIDEIHDTVTRLGPWFQNLDLRGVQTARGPFDQSAVRWSYIEPLVPADLSGKTVLDLGCNAGWFAVKLRERGAKVLGVDWYPQAIEQAVYAADVLGLDIEYRLQNLYQYVLQTEERFDIVLFLGVFYHLRYPLLVLDRLAEITRERLYFQTVLYEPTEPPAPLEVPNNITAADLGLLDNPDFPRLYFIEKSLRGAYNNWFICSRSAARAVLRSAGFTDIEETGPDCFVCAPERSGWRAAHDLDALKPGEPPPVVSGGPADGQEAAAK